MAELRKYGWGEAHRPEPAFPTVRVYVWELPVRVSHWIIFLSVIVLSVTGYFIHNPFIVARSSTTFLMATIRFIHEITGFVFIAAFLLRLYWFFMGNSWANWRGFVPVHRRQGRGGRRRGGGFCAKPTAGGGGAWAEWWPITVSSAKTWCIRSDTMPWLVSPIY